MIGFRMPTRPSYSTFVSVVFLCFFWAASSDDPGDKSTKCSFHEGTHAFLWRRLSQNGFHGDMEVSVELMATGWVPPGNCRVLLINTMPKGAYVYPNELADLQESGISETTFLVGGKVNVEVPENMAEPHKLFTFAPLNATENLLKASVGFPLHMRYHAAVDGSHPNHTSLEAKVSFAAPRMLVSCENMELDRACLRLSIKAPCEWTNSSRCTWLGVKYKTNSALITAAVPVGDTSLWLVVAIGTVVVAGAACMYLIIVIHRKDKEFLASEMEKLKMIQRMHQGGHRRQMSDEPRLYPSDSSTKKDD